MNGQELMVKVGTAYSYLTDSTEAIAPVTQDSEKAIWKWLSILSVVSSLGMLLIAFSNIGSYPAASWALLCFWGGLLLVFAPTLLRLLSHRASRNERVGLVVLMVSALYFIKIIHSPISLTFADEWVHIYNVQTILRHHALFSENPVIQASAFYPGLESVCAALASLSGLSIFVSGLVIIGIARLILVLSLFLLFERVGGSARVAGIATALYMTHSNFLFWSAQFSYESLSFPLAMAILMVAVFREDTTTPNEYGGYTFVALLGIGAVTMTHHLTAYFLTLFFSIWSVIHYFRIQLWVIEKIELLLPQSWLKVLGRSLRAKVSIAKEGGQSQPSGIVKHGSEKALPGSGGLALFAFIASITWLFFVATQTISYLSPVLMRAVQSMINMIFAEEEGRQLFVSSSGYVAPLWERVIGIASVLLGLMGLPFGLLQVWRKYLINPFVLILTLFALGYFALFSLRFSSAAWETGNRASAYMFVGLCFVLALGISEIWLSNSKGWGMRLATVAYASILLMGGVIAGWSPQMRLAQPFRLDVNGQSIVPEGQAVASWTNEALGTKYVFGADEANGRYLLVEGGQYTLIGRHPNITDIIQSTQLDKWQLEGIHQWQLRYMLVDRRVISWNNMAGYFFNRKNDSVELFDKEVYSKFDKIDGVDRLLDSGNIVIYDIGALDNATDLR